MSDVAAVLIGGPPATGKSTLAMAPAPRLDAAILDLDVDLAPLTRVVSELTGLHDLDDPALTGLTRDARYDTLLGLAAANLAAGRPLVLVAPFTLDRFTDIIRIGTEDGGASGFIAGRSVWREVVSLTGPQRQGFLTSVALPRLERLIGVAECSARPWTEVSRPALATAAIQSGPKRGADQGE